MGHSRARWGTAGKAGEAGEAAAVLGTEVRMSVAELSQGRGLLGENFLAKWRGETQAVRERGRETERVLAK